MNDADTNFIMDKTITGVIVKYNNSLMLQLGKIKSADEILPITHKLQALSELAGLILDELKKNGDDSAEYDDWLKSA